MPRAIPWVQVVLPAPKGPSIITTSPALRLRPSFSPQAWVSSAVAHSMLRILQSSQVNASLIGTLRASCGTADDFIVDSACGIGKLCSTLPAFAKDNDFIIWADPKWILA